MPGQSLNALRQWALCSCLLALCCLLTCGCTSARLKEARLQMAAQLTDRPAPLLRASADLTLPYVAPRALACALGPDHRARLLVLTHERELRCLTLVDDRIEEDRLLARDHRGDALGLGIGPDGTVMVWAGDHSWRAPPDADWHPLPDLTGLKHIAQGPGYTLALVRAKGSTAGSGPRFNLFVIGGPGAAALIPWWDRPAKLSLHKLEGQEWKLHSLVNRDDRLGFERLLATQVTATGELQVLFESNRAVILAAPEDARQLLRVPHPLSPQPAPIPLQASGLPVKLPTHWSSGQPLGEPRLSASQTVDLCMARSTTLAFVPHSGALLEVKTLPNFPAQLCAWEPGPDDTPVLCPLLVDATPAGPSMELHMMDQDRAALLLRLSRLEFLGESKAGLALMLRLRPGTWTRPQRLVSTSTPERALLASSQDRLLLIWTDDEKKLRARWLFPQ